ncbi:hypothetical protein PR048_008377 [Dryococelus australis]|uniref:HAT C-terminal dimerisation domain-containing protein n=1 Tax=Dryococelus australis TaxID=614101 RepID=A0ABQ9HWY6_9NEOP|nr:hypothetical protein PR048_008377 [Dryococelus australis]
MQEETSFNIEKLFHPKYVVNNAVDDSFYAVAKKVPLVPKLSQQKFFDSYLAFQSQVCMNNTQTLWNNLVSALWIPPSNADSERAFSAYSHILSNLRTNINPQNLAVLFKQYFGIGHS